jgi:outer membrane protein OmpA-like peptidoglycan-associated protein
VSYVKAKVSDKKTKKAIQADIDLINLSYSPPQSHLEHADEKGEVTLALPLQRNYSFNVTHPGYLFYSKSILLKDSSSLVNPFALAIELEPIEVGAKMELYNIYYETDSFRILPQSEPELSKLVVFLKNNAGLKVQIQGHTDSSGNPERNQKLSEMRASSVVDYLVNHGIAKSRLQSEGYGDKVPVTDNATEEGRRQNRRTTVKILGN